MSVKPGRTSDRTPRRSFMQAVGAMIAGALAGLAPVAAAAPTLLDPLRRRGGGQGAILKVTHLSGLSDGGALPELQTGDRGEDPRLALRARAPDGMPASPAG